MFFESREGFRGKGMKAIIKAKTKLYTPNVISFLYLEKLDSISPSPKPTLLQGRAHILLQYVSEFIKNR